MAIIRKGLPNKGRGNFTKIDNKVFLINGLTDGAKVLYGYMASMRQGEDYSDKFFMRGLQLSEKSLYRRKKELSNCGLIYVDRVGLKNYILYIGYTDVSARMVKANWDYIKKTNQDGISYQELVDRTAAEHMSNPDKNMEPEYDENAGDYKSETTPLPDAVELMGIEENDDSLDLEEEDYMSKQNKSINSIFQDE